MTDRRAPAGYAQDSLFPAECGGPLRLKAPVTPGLAIQPGETLSAISRNTERWNVMFLWKGTERLYLYGTSLVGSGDPAGWVEEVDPETLEPLRRSPDLPCGGHIWCGAMVMHENGDIYVVNGRYIHRLDAELNVLAERELPADRPYNGVLVMADGALLTKELRLSGDPSALVLLDPLTLAIRLVKPMLEPSMGRLAAERRPDGSDHVYVPGDEHVFRYLHREGRLTGDNTWRPRYRKAGSPGGLAWDTCLGDGGVWLHDNGDIPTVRSMHAAHPAGSQPPTFSPDAFTTPVRLLRIAMDDAARIDVLEPSGRPNGWVIAPPVYVPGLRIAVAFDTGNGAVCAWRHESTGAFTPLWTAAVVNWWQPLVHLDTAELVLDDMVDGDDNLVVLDLLTGAEKARRQTGSPIPNGMFPCPGRARDLYYVSSPVVARVRIEPLQAPAFASDRGMVATHVQG